MQLSLLLWELRSSISIWIHFQIWPIFAQGGEYGPKYEILDESQKRSEVNEYVDDENNLYFNPLTMTKKDLESLLHQPDPALTVQQLPQNPKISFRKGHPSEQKGNTDNSKTIPCWNQYRMYCIFIHLLRTYRNWNGNVN